MKTFTYGARTIAYQLEHTDRKTLAITVQPDLRVQVRAPHGADAQAIERILRKRAAWILRQQRFFAQFLPRTPPRQYISGETHFYLGRQYRLRVREAETEEVKLLGGHLCVFLPSPQDTTRVRDLLQQWYRSHADARLLERFQMSLAVIAEWNVPAPRLQISPMRRRWGSYSPAGTLTLHPDLIRAPRACIDYVILHELCHTRYPHHKAEFYHLLTSLMPDWKTRKARLETLLS